MADDDLDALLDELQQRRTPDASELIGRFRREQRYRERRRPREQREKVRLDAEQQLSAKRKLKSPTLVLERKDAEWLRSIQTSVSASVLRKELSRC